MAGDGNGGSILRDANLQLVFAVSLMAVMGVTVITPAFPAVIERFAISGQQVGLLVTAFTLPGILLTPLMGMAADLYGRRRILIPSLLAFGVFGGLCFFAGDFDTLLVLRFLQGIGSAALVSLNVTIIGDLYSGRACDAAMGYNAGVMSMGAASFPGIGGALALMGWNYPFALPFVAIPIAIAVFLTMRNPEPRLDRRLIKHMRETWKTAAEPRAILLLLMSMISFLVFFGAFLSYFPLLMENSFGSSSLVIGLVMSSMSIVTGVVSSRLGWLTRHLQKRRLLQLAFVFYVVSLLLIPLMPRLELILVPMALFGLAQGLNIPVVQSGLAHLVPIESRGGFMSINGLALRTGQTLGPVLMGIALSLYGIDSIFYLGAALAMLGLMLALLLSRVRSDGLGEWPQVDGIPVQRSTR